MKWLVGDLTRISWLRSVWAKRAVCEQRISQNCPAPVGLSSFQPLLQAAFAKLGGRRVPPASFDHLQSVVGRFPPFSLRFSPLANPPFSLSLLDIDFFVGLCLPVGKPVVPLQIYERNRKSGFLDSPFVFWTSLVHMYQVSEGCFRYSLLIGTTDSMRKNHRLCPQVQRGRKLDWRSLRHLGGHH
jgi:hypothetical protein